MAWRRPGDKPLSEPMMVSLPTHICVTQPQWVKQPGDFLEDLILVTNKVPGKGNILYETGPEQYHNACQTISIMDTGTLML